AERRSAEPTGYRPADTAGLDAPRVTPGRADVRRGASRRTDVRERAGSGIDGRNPVIHRIRDPHPDAPDAKQQVQGRALARCPDLHRYPADG
ncbi:MAG TPA: hypothetical protein VIJ00_01875, partial [Nakamurella sp.]